MADWIPASEDAFAALANQFVTTVSTTPAQYGVLPADGTRLTAELYDYTVKSAAVEGLRAQLAAVVEARDTSRGVLEPDIRSTGARIQANPNVTDAQRAAADLPVRKTSRTPVPTPDTVPVLSINSSRRLEHIISWRDQSSPTSKARPAGVAGLELYIKIGTAPTSVDDCRALGMITRSPNLEEFGAADGGKTAYYIGRWVNTRGEHGPTSEIASATIAAQT